MPLVLVTRSQFAKPEQAFAQSSGDIPGMPGHLYECYDWQLLDTAPDDIARIPPDSWLGQIAYKSHPLPAEHKSPWKFTRSPKEPT